MKKTVIFPSLCIAFTALCTGPIYGATPTPAAQMLFDKPRDAAIIVNNRILAKVNGKPISVVDLMKQMDLVFYRQYAEYALVAEARLQFYQASWKKVLKETIDKELILAEAEEKKIPVSAGDVRQEMEEQLGPNIIETLDKAGITMSEARAMVKADITMRRMTSYLLYTKALKNATPEAIRQAYDKYSKDEKNQLPSIWDYQVISVRHPSKEKGAFVAKHIYALIALNPPTSSLADVVKNIPLDDPEAAVNVSETFHTDPKEISPAYKQVLETLAINTYSQPVEQKGKSDKSVIHRIFYLKAKNEGGAPPFNQVASQIKDQLISMAMEKETEVYLQGLRKKYGISEQHLKEMVPDNFTPFTLR